MDEGGEWYGGYATEVEESGITVAKGIDIESLPLPAIRYRVQNERDRRVAVRISERLPVEVPVENIGFHREHRANRWAPFEDGHLEYIGPVESGETVETLYCVWLSEPREMLALLREHDVEVEPIARDRTLEDHEGDVPKRHVDDAIERGGSLDGMVDDIAAALGGTAEDDAADASTTETPDDGTADDTDVIAAPPPSEDAIADESATAEASESTSREGTPASEPEEQTTQDDSPAGASASEGGATDEVSLTWAEHVERVGTPPDPPGEATVRDLEDEAEHRRFFLRGRVVDGHHGGGAVAVFQELSNALSVLGRRVEGVDDRAERVDAVVATDLGTDAITDALGERDQVEGALVAALDPPADETSAEGGAVEGVDATDEVGDPTVDTDDEPPEFDDVEEEVDPISAAELEDELEEVDFPEIDTEDEPGIDELVFGTAEDEGETSDRSSPEIREATDEDIDVPPVEGRGGPAELFATDDDASDGKSTLDANADEVADLRAELDALRDRMTDIERRLAALEGDEDDDNTREGFVGMREEFEGDGDPVEETEESADDDASEDRSDGPDDSDSTGEDRNRDTADGGELEDVGPGNDDAGGDEAGGEDRATAVDDVEDAQDEDREWEDVGDDRVVETATDDGSDRDDPGQTRR